MYAQYVRHNDVLMGVHASSGYAISIPYSSFCPEFFDDLWILRCMGVSFKRPKNASNGGVAATVGS
jgi:hypothetical protein